MPDSRFKPYEQNQMRLLPLDLSDMVPQNHMARVVDSLIESIDLAPLKALYSGGGAPAYDPRMMLKVVTFAYASGIYSSRKISEAMRSNIYFLWLSGCTAVDHMTINRFRTERLRGALEGVFAECVDILFERGLVTLDTYFLDGTKIEANANKYTFAWRKAIEGNKGKLQVKVGRLLDEIDRLNDEEDALSDDAPEPGEVTSEDIAEAARRINERLKSQPENRDLKRAKKKIESDFLPRMARYEQDLADMEGRRSLSKTDRDATFMRMKEDHMQNGQLKAGYNIQNGTENQFVIHSSVHQRPGDTGCMKPHLEALREKLGHLPRNIVADAGYGSEENYEYLEEAGVRAFVKYAWFHKEQKRSFKQDPTQPANWTYDEKDDEYACAGNKKLAFLHERKQKSDLGFESKVRVYGCSDCKGCPYAAKCIKTEGAENRRIYVNPHLAGYRSKASELLTSDEGRIMRRRRATDVETVFGDTKHNWGFKRFTLRGLAKVDHEWRLAMLGHNVRKLTKALMEGLPVSGCTGCAPAMAK